MTFFVEQGDTRIPITPLDADQTVEDFYGYRENRHPHSHTPSHIERDNVSELFLWKEPTGETTLGIIHDDRYDSGGGDVTFEFSGLADSAEWVVRDDDSGNDSYFGLSRAEWHWGSNHTDGGAIRNLTASDSSVPFANDLSIQIDGTGEKVPLSNGWHYTKRYENRTIEGLEPPVYVIVFADNAPFDSPVPSGHPQQGYDLDGDEIIPKVTDSRYQDDLYLVMQPHSESTALKFVTATSANNNSLWYEGEELIPDSKAAAEGTIFELPAFEDQLVTITPTFKNGINDWQVLSGDSDNPDRHSLDMTEPITIGSGSGDVTGKLTTLSFFPGLSEDSTGGGDELNSALPDYDGKYVDNWFHGDFQTKLEENLNKATDADRKLEEFPGESFKHYRFKNQVEVSFSTSGSTSIDTNSIEVNCNEDTVEITLEKEGNQLRKDLINDTLFEGKNKMKATPRERYLNVDMETINGVDAVRVSTIWGAFDPYVELMLEYVADNTLRKLLKVLQTPLFGDLADIIITTPTIYTWMELIVTADGTQLARIVDASRYPKHAGYLDNDKMDTNIFERGQDWQVSENENSRFKDWTLEEQSHLKVPYESPNKAYLSKFDKNCIRGVEEGPHPIMYFGKDNSGPLPLEKVKDLLPNDYLNPF